MCTGGKNGKASIIRSVGLSVMEDCCKKEEEQEGHQHHDHEFAKFDNTRYWEADELTIREIFLAMFQIREKIWAMFQNMLLDNYRSNASK